ncbi:protein jag [Frigoribacterium sp. 2-23]|uniref:Jag family protein n=1 Tax=Frigoribacterium sp. 2-23 TaxID=3415006 RepID=UPI003C703CE8
MDNTDIDQTADAQRADAQAAAPDVDDATTASSAVGDDTAATSSSDVDGDEGDIAADYIEELLDICDLDGDIDIEVRSGRSYISIDSSGDSNLRVLSKPDTVNALQELARIAVQTKTGEFSRLILDIGGSRATRETELGALVDRAVERLEEGATAASLPPMSSYERKLVHDIVAARGFTSESQGEGRDRHTVITRAS